MLDSAVHKGPLGIVDIVFEHKAFRMMWRFPQDIVVLPGYIIMSELGITAWIFLLLRQLESFFLNILIRRTLWKKNFGRIRGSLCELFVGLKLLREAILFGIVEILGAFFISTLLALDSESIMKALLHPLRSRVLVRSP